VRGIRLISALCIVFVVSAAAQIEVSSASLTEKLTGFEVLGPVSAEADTSNQGSSRDPATRYSILSKDYFRAYKIPHLWTPPYLFREVSRDEGTAVYQFHSCFRGFHNFHQVSPELELAGYQALDRV